MLKRQYDNISLWCYDGDSDPEVTPGPTAPVPEPTPDTRIVVFSNDFSDEFEADRYTPYEDGSLDDTDRIYLVVTHNSGTHGYDNLIIWIDGSTATSAEGLEVTAPVLGETGGYITVANSAKTLAVFIVYTASYNDDETLESFSSAPCEV